MKVGEEFVAASDSVSISRKDCFLVRSRWGEEEEEMEEGRTGARVVSGVEVMVVAGCVMRAGRVG